MVENGVYDAATEQAVRRFQQAHQLEVDGVAGPDTDRALASALAHQPPQQTVKEVPAIEEGSPMTLIAADPAQPGKLFALSPARGCAAASPPRRR